MVLKDVSQPNQIVRVKIVPRQIIEEYLTPLALAI